MNKVNSSNRAPGLNQAPGLNGAARSDEGRGPMERALDAAVERAVGWEGPLPDGAQVEWVRRRNLGDFRFDLRPLLGGEWPQPADTDRVIAALESCPEIESARLTMPRVHLSVRLETFGEVVLDSIAHAATGYGKLEDGAGRTAAVTFSDPNVNKPLHVGHLRNNILGIALARMLENQGWKVRRSELCSDWGLHICRALVGYLYWGDGATPASAGVPGDVLVGEGYVRFHRESAKQIRGARSARGGPLLEDQAAELLRRLEHGGDVRLAALQARLTGWVEDGIDQIYTRLGCQFEGRFRESTNREVGGELIERGLANGACRRREDGSVCVDVTDAGHAEFGELTLLRPDGTQLVYTRAFGALVERNRLHPAERVVEVLGADWELAYPAFLEALARLGETWANDIEMVFHGMVRTADSAMRSRDGSVVSARELLDEAARGMAARWGLPLDEADAAGVALTKLHLLGYPRDREIVFDGKAVWSGSYPRLATLVEVSAQAARSSHALGSPDQPRSPGQPRSPDLPGLDDKAAAAAWRELLHALDGFPRVVERATRDLEPSLVVRHLDDLCGAVEQVSRTHDLGAAWAAVDTVLSRGRWLLGIDLPLPQLLLSRREPGAELAATPVTSAAGAGAEPTPRDRELVEALP